MKNFLLQITTITLISISSVNAQSYKTGATINNNGQVSATSSSFQMQAIMGQAAVGTIKSTNFEINAGFIPVTLSSQFIDLAIENLALNPTTVGQGGAISISFDVRNLDSGTLPGGSYAIGVFLSTDEIIDAGEELRTISIPDDIGAGGTYIFPQNGDDASLTIPGNTTPASYFIILRADNGDVIAESDETNNEITASLTVTGDSEKPVLDNFNPVSYFSTGRSVSVNASDNVGIDSVNFYHRGIRTNSNWTKEEVSGTGLYSITLDALWLDELGVEYWFEAIDDSSNRDSTAVEYTYAQTPGGVLLLPAIPAGSKQSNYQMISIPFDLTNKAVTNVFSKLGTYDPTKWRMFHYTNGNTNEYNQGWSTIELDKSYWIIHNVADAGQFFVGEGKAVQKNKTDQNIIKLVEGWNQIGNPYRFDVSWNDILAASGNPTEVEKFRVWADGSFSDGTTLKSFGGGFVFTGAPVNITIPVAGSGSGGRIEETDDYHYPLDNPNWQVTYELTNDDLIFRFGGFGMHQEATEGKDRYDDIAMPRLPNYVDINFIHPEYFIPKFNKDVVPTAEAKTWFFTVDKNSPLAETTLTWDNSYYGNNSKQLFLVDLEHNKIIDMRETTAYTFEMAKKHRFKLIFGDGTYLAQELVPTGASLNQNYPNPFSTTTSIPFALPNTFTSYNVDLVIINKLGQEVKQLIRGDLQPGYYETEWDGTDDNGQKLGSGLYIYRMRVNTGKDVLSYSKHIIIN